MFTRNFLSSFDYIPPVEISFQLSPQSLVDLYVCITTWRSWGLIFLPFDIFKFSIHQRSSGFAKLFKVTYVSVLRYEAPVDNCTEFLLVRPLELWTKVD